MPQSTLKSNLVIPEVLAPMINSKLTDNMVFFPIVEFDDTLVGQPGDVITFPVYNYIGDATVVDEDGEIKAVALTTDTKEKKVVKTGKAVRLTDEAMLSAYGNPVDESAKQIALAIDNKADNDILAELKKISPVRQYANSAPFTPDHVAEALAIFGEDEAGVKALYMNADDRATLRKDKDYIKPSDMGQEMMLKGTAGELYGCNIIVSNKIKKDPVTGDVWRFIVKPGAVKLIRKRSVLLEVEREATFARSTLVATYHYVAYLYNESLAVAMREFTKLNEVTTITSVAGTTASNDTLIKIPADIVAPKGYKWIYKLGTTDVTPVFGTALSGYTDWVSGATEIAGGANTKAILALVNATDNKPVLYQNVTLVKKV